MRTTLSWFGLGGARVRRTLYRMKDLSVPNSNQRSSMSCMNSSSGRLPSAPSQSPNSRKFFLLLRFSRSSVLDTRKLISFMALISSVLFFSKGSSADIIRLSASSSAWYWKRHFASPLTYCFQRRQSHFAQALIYTVQFGSESPKLRANRF